MKHVKELLAVVAALTMATTLAACGGEKAAPAARELTKINYGTASPVPAIDQAPYSSIPIQMGYWEEEGLDVEILGFEGSGSVFQAIAAGKIDAGQGPPGPLFSAVASGTGLKAFYDHVPHNFLMPAVPEGSDITEISQIKGKTVGVANLEAGGVTLIKAMAHSAGLSEADFNIVPIGRGAEAKAFIERGDIDVLELWDSAYAELGIPYTMIRDPYFEKIGFHNAVTTTAERLETDRDVMVGLARGIAKATLFVHENPEKAVELHWKQFPESKPVGVSDEAAMKQALTTLTARNVNTQPLPQGWGYADDEIVTGHMQMLLDGGVLKQTVAASDLWDGSLLADINDFDPEQIKAEAHQ